MPPRNPWILAGSPPYCLASIRGFCPRPQIALFPGTAEMRCDGVREAQCMTVGGLQRPWRRPGWGLRVSALSLGEYTRDLPSSLYAMACRLFRPLVLQLAWHGAKTYGVLGALTWRDAAVSSTSLRCEANGGGLRECGGGGVRWTGFHASRVRVSM
jgi:hypothetical protein